jgi:hypothetical protein
MRLLIVPTVLAVTLCGCPGGDGAIGESCSDNSSCRGELQCFQSVCVPRCERAPECGDGYRCDDDGVCHAATGQAGDACESEVDCAAGLACQVVGMATTDDGLLQASCVADSDGRPSSDVCEADSDCRNGTCDLGHCVDLCRETIDCGTGTSCTKIPRVASGGLPYLGCLQSSGSLTWSIPVTGTNEMVPLPIPDSARGVSVLFSVEDPNQKVGATLVSAPDGKTLLDTSTPALSYYANPYLRHRPDFGQSVLAMPESPAAPLQSGTYNLRVKSSRPGIPIDINGTAIPSITAVIKVDSGTALDLHFYFLDLTDHPCKEAFGGTLDASVAPTADFFVGETGYTAELRRLFAKGGITLNNITYADLPGHPDLDGLDVASAPSLLALGEYANGINVFFVRTLSPVGLQAFGPNPGPAGIPGTRQSGIVIGVDTLCYRSWTQLARITVRESAKFMGLFNTVEADFSATNTTPQDLLPDTDPASMNNLLFFSEFGGEELSDGQRFVLTRSPALR